MKNFLETFEELNKLNEDISIEKQELANKIKAILHKLNTEDFVSKLPSEVVNNYKAILKHPDDFRIRFWYCSEALLAKNFEAADPEGLVDKELDNIYNGRYYSQLLLNSEDLDEMSKMHHEPSKILINSIRKTNDSEIDLEDAIKAISDELSYDITYFNIYAATKLLAEIPSKINHVLVNSDNKYYWVVNIFPRYGASLFKDTQGNLKGLPVVKELATDKEITAVEDIKNVLDKATIVATLSGTADYQPYYGTSHTEELEFDSKLPEAVLQKLGIATENLVDAEPIAAPYKNSTIDSRLLLADFEDYTD